jgi:hypothetical protein
MSDYGFGAKLSKSEPDTIDIFGLDEAVVLSENEVIVIGDKLCSDGSTASVAYVLENIMAQQDNYELGVGGIRDLNSIRARLVASTGQDTTLKVDWGVVTESGGVESWSFTDTYTSAVASSYHDFNFGTLSPNTLYAFKVTAIHPTLGELESAVHFFKTEEEFVLGFSIVLTRTMVEVEIARYIVSLIDGSKITLVHSTDATEYTPLFSTASSILSSLVVDEIPITVNSDLSIALVVT